MEQYKSNSTKENKPNLSVITEQGDLGLGTRELTDEEQKEVDKTQKRFYEDAYKYKS